MLCLWPEKLGSVSMVSGIQLLMFATVSFLLTIINILHIDSFF